MYIDPLRLQKHRNDMKIHLLLKEQGARVVPSNPIESSNSFKVLEGIGQEIEPCVASLNLSQRAPGSRPSVSDGIRMIL